MCVLESLLFRAKGAARDDGRPAGRRGKEIGADRRGTENAEGQDGEGSEKESEKDGRKREKGCIQGRRCG